MTLVTWIGRQGRALRFLLALLVLVPASPALSQTAEPTPAAAAIPLKADDVQRALATLTDEAEREKLVSQLRAIIDARNAVEPAAAARPFGARLLDTLSERVGRLGSQVVIVANYAVDLPDAWAWVSEQAALPENRARWAEIVLKVAVTLAAGIMVEALVRRLLSRPRRAIEGHETDRALVRFALLAVRTLLDTLAILAFAASTYALVPLLELNGQTRLAVLAIINANVIVRIAAALARMVLAPQAASLRFVGLSDDAARYLFVWVTRVTAISLYGYFFARVLYILGITQAAYVVLLKLLGIVVTVLLVLLVVRNRVRVANALRGMGHDAQGRRTVRSRLADIWHVLAVAYILAICGVWILQVDEGFTYLLRATVLSIVILVAARIAVTLAREALRRGFSLGPDLKLAFPNLEEHAVRYLPVVRYVVSGLIWAMAAVGILHVWGMPLSRIAGPGVFGAAVRIVLVLAIAVGLWELFRFGLARSLRRSAVNGQATRPSARARTLVPLVEKFALIILTVIVGLMVLAELGVDIAPLLAGAGIIGIAVGFGAQSLVKDVITGLFILIEDQFAVGDVVELAGKGGVVEDISLRTIRVRAYNGTVYVIPFSEVGTTANLTKGFSYYVFEVGVAYRENVDDVMAVLRAIGDEIVQDPRFGPLVLPPFEVAGVDKLADSAVVIKCRVKTLPSQQWSVGRELNRRIKNRFDELGIEIPFPHQTIYFGVDKQGSAPPVRVVSERRDTAGAGQGVRPDGGDATVAGTA